MPAQQPTSKAAKRWAVLGLMSVALAWLFETVHLPAALLLGPLVAAAVMAARGATSVVPSPVFRLAHAVVGLLIARTLAMDTLAELLRDWHIFLAGTIFVVAASGLIGWALTRWRVLPGTTAIWGSAPGAATVMVIMAGSFGADTRLVAFMQYLRVVTVVAVATLVARVWIGEGAVSRDPIDWFPHVQPGALGATLLLIVAGAQLGHFSRVPAGALLVPMALGAVLSNAGLVSLELPPWLLAPTYAVIGWQVGSRFDRPILLHALRALPRLLAATFVLIAVCAAFSALLVAMADIDPLTAYLATSPGGIDSVAIIGMAGHADMPFVMAMQMTRFLLVLIVGPWVATRIARAAGETRS